MPVCVVRFMNSTVGQWVYKSILKWYGIYFCPSVRYIADNNLSVAASMIKPAVSLIRRRFPWLSFMIQWSQTGFSKYGNAHLLPARNLLFHWSGSFQLHTRPVYSVSIAAEHPVIPSETNTPLTLITFEIDYLTKLIPHTLLYRTAYISCWWLSPPCQQPSERGRRG